MGGVRREFSGHTQLINEHGGTYLASGIKPNVREGDQNPNAYVLLEFPDLESAEKWYEDPRYKPLVDLRNSGGRSDIYIFPGMPTEDDQA